MGEDSLQSEIEAAINRRSAENGSNTPDFILARYLIRCLAAWNEGVTERERWYGRDPNKRFYRMARVRWGPPHDPHPSAYG